MRMRITLDHTHVHVQVNLLADAMTIDSFPIRKGEEWKNTAQLCGYLCMIFAMLTQNQHQLFIHPTIRLSRFTLSLSPSHYRYSSVISLSISASLFLSSFHSVNDQNNLSFFLTAAFDFASSFRSFFSLRQKSPSSNSEYWKSKKHGK